MTPFDAEGLQPNEALCRMLSIPRALRTEEIDRIVTLAQAVSPVAGEVIVLFSVKSTNARSFFGDQTLIFTNGIILLKRNPPRVKPNVTVITTLDRAMLSKEVFNTERLLGGIAGRI